MKIRTRSLRLLALAGAAAFATLLTTTSRAQTAFVVNESSNSVGKYNASNGAAGSTAFITCLNNPI